MSFDDKIGEAFGWCVLLLWTVILFGTPILVFLSLLKYIGG